jgi:hypothetical protein
MNSNHFVFIVQIFDVSALLFFLLFQEGLLVEHTPHAIFLVDEQFGYYEPDEAAETALLFVGEGFEDFHDLAAYVTESIIVEEVLVPVELDDVTAKVEEDGPTAGIL